MSFNNASIVKFIADDLDSSTFPPLLTPDFRPRVSSQPCLIQRLPLHSFLQREADIFASQTLSRDSQHSPTSPLEEEIEESPENSQSDYESTPSSPISASSIKSFLTRTFTKSRDVILSPTEPWREPQPFEVFSAIERKDIVYLMEIRDRAFPLLLRRSGDITPLLHAMRIGQSHRDVAIVLLGAFSRYINNLQDEDIPRPHTKAILRSLRTNLKLAIDFGLAKSQVDLTASFMQTLIMSEGDKWVWEQVTAVSRALRADSTGKPVQEAEAAVRRFATRELGKADLIASLEDYVANATADLVMLGAWSLVLESVKADVIPSWYFARDDRVYKAFVEALDQYKSEIQRSVGRRLKWQLGILRRAMEGRTTTYRRKIEMLSFELDEHNPA
ncbi:hypothetical protein AMATHDRAFT_74985 [Amanita thiersii Skay4041]|uniref:Uncharacterized protein n=1 Tax=Amanita thiersii Skay4041 TaxID=703135 RepID=A0A2A9NMW5_9AGAR|nr:hypothetical protein AMATHDRAFT_74985 [Amanita thiersii Skay4041]